MIHGNLKWTLQNGRKGSMVRKETNLFFFYLCCPLAPTREGIKEADTSGGHQQQGKDDVVHCGEVHLDYLPHDDAGYGGGIGGVKAVGRVASRADHNVKESASASPIWRIIDTWRHNNKHRR